MNCELEQNTAAFHIEEMQAIFAKELTSELARVYVASLIEKLGGANQPLERLIDKGCELHFKIGKDLYGPLLVGFSQWVTKKVAEIEHSGPVFFALRDAAPLKAAAEVMWNGKNIYPVGIYANRPLFGIEDEIAPEWAKIDGNFIGYLESLGLTNLEKVAWVDSGAWGTVPKVLKLGLLKEAKYYPFFWFSHNQYIPGYLNELISGKRINEKFGEILNDSLECVFPQPYTRPLDVLQTSGGWQMVLNPSGLLSLKWGQAALLGVQQCALEMFVNGGINEKEEFEALENLVNLSQIADKHGIWTGVLPINTPTWSKGKEFLLTWPPNLLP